MGRRLIGGRLLGGSAAAVAAGLSWGDLGSDLSGSIRVPAAWNGVCGHRPSSGVVSKRGHLPWPVGTRLEPSASAAGPIARSAEDTAALFAVLAGSASSGPWRLALPEPRFTRPSELRVGLWLSEETAPVDDETAEALAALAGRLEEAGATVVDLGPSVLGTPEAEELFDRLILHEIAYPSGESAPLARVWADWDEQLRLREGWEGAIASVDVVLAPTVPFAAPPFPIDEADRRTIGRWSCMANLAAGPSTVVPIALGAVSGLPIAAQLIGAHGHDLTTLGAARLLADEGIVPRVLAAPVLA